MDNDWIPILDGPGVSVTYTHTHSCIYCPAQATEICENARPFQKENHQSKSEMPAMYCILSICGMFSSTCSWKWNTFKRLFYNHILFIKHHDFNQFALGGPNSLGALTREQVSIIFVNEKRESILKNREIAMGSRSMESEFRADMTRS